MIYNTGGRMLHLVAVTDGLLPFQNYIINISLVSVICHMYYYQFSFLYFDVCNSEKSLIQSFCCFYIFLILFIIIFHSFIRNSLDYINLD